MSIEEKDNKYYLNKEPTDIICLLVYKKESTMGDIFVSDKTYKSDFYRFSLDVVTKLQQSFSEYDEDLNDIFDEFRDKLQNRLVQRCETETINRTMGEEVI